MNLETNGLIGTREATTT